MASCFPTGSFADTSAIAKLYRFSFIALVTSSNLWKQSICSGINGRLFVMDLSLSLPLLNINIRRLEKSELGRWLLFMNMAVLSFFYIYLGEMGLLCLHYTITNVQSILFIVFIPDTSDTFLLIPLHFLLFSHVNHYTYYIISATCK